MTPALAWAAALDAACVLWFGIAAARPWGRAVRRSPTGWLLAAAGALMAVLLWCLAAIAALVLVDELLQPVVGPIAAALIGAVPPAGAALLLSRRRRGARKKTS